MKQANLFRTTMKRHKHTYYRNGKQHSDNYKMYMYMCTKNLFLRYFKNYMLLQALKGYFPCCEKNNNIYPGESTHICIIHGICFMVLFWVNYSITNMATPSYILRLNSKPEQI